MPVESTILFRPSLPRVIEGNPVWFVLEGDKLYLLPVQGSDTKMCCITRRFGLMRGALEQNSGQRQSPMPKL
jgi:hypothetical protein